MAIPEFVDGYHLPAGEHVATLEEVEKRFANSTAMRRKVWTSFKGLMERLEQLEIYPEVVLIDGSFVTGREEPEDVDFAALISPQKVDEALKKSNQHDNRGIQMLLKHENQLAIRDLFGTHLLVAYDENILQGWSYFFRRGDKGTLRDPDPKRDPNWVKKPEEKGIIRVELSSKS